MLSEETKRLQFDQSQKSVKVPIFIYADLKWIIKRIDGCKNNPENLSIAKVSGHIPSDFSKSTISSLTISSFVFFVSQIKTKD